MSMAEAAVAEARLWIGTPYRHQASARGAGADCLGLVRGVWRALYTGEPEAVPPYTADWSEPEGVERLWVAALRHLVPAAALGPGQVVLFRMRDGAVAKHLGITARRDGAESVIHAFAGHGVVENALAAPWARRVVARFDFPERA
jgi:NlpC/P60 family putative phage cell wall peptidase